MHFSYVAKFAGALVLTIGLNVLVLGSQRTFEDHPDKASPVNIVLAVLLLVSIIWMMILLWGLVLRALLWLRAGKYGSFRTSHDISLLLFGKDDPRVRAVRVRQADGMTQFYYITRGLTVTRSTTTVRQLPLSNREVAALRSVVEEMINNARANQLKRIIT